MLLRDCKFFFALGTILPATLAFDFINPASHGGQTSFAQNAVYAEREILEIQWTEPETWQDATVALYQVDINKTSATDVSPTTIGELEYIAGELPSDFGDMYLKICANIHVFVEGQAFNRTSRRWIVITNKDLSVSPVFVMMLFVTEATTASDETVYFNITSGETTAASSSSASATASSTLSTTPSIISATSTATASESASTNNTPALSSSAKIGLGVGIPVAAIVGVLATWLALRRRRVPYQSNSGGQQGDNGGPPQENKSVSAFDASTVASLRPVSGTIAYNRPASNTHGPGAGNGLAPEYGPASNRPVYEFHNDHFAVNELDAQNTRRY